MKEEFEEVDLFDNDKPEEQAVEDVDLDTTKETSFEVPDKFQGKSFEDVIESYENLEKEMGRKANEVGELRKLTDDILKQQVTEQEAPLQEDIGFEDFIDDPSLAVSKALESNPRLKKIEDALARDSQEKSHQQLLSKHEDADAVVSSPEFSEWVQKSPTRLRMLQEAHVNYDAEIASDLLDFFKGSSKMTIDEAKAVRDGKAAGDLKKAQIEKGTNGATSKKVYRRTDLIRLKLEDPNRYASMSNEIRKAYAEKRVK